MMGHRLVVSEAPLVSLEADKLLGPRQVAKVSGKARAVLGYSAHGTLISQVEVSRLLSKIGTEEPSES
jgi:hypothetical protein